MIHQTLPLALAQLLENVHEDAAEVVALVGGHQLCPGPGAIRPPRRRHAL